MHPCIQAILCPLGSAVQGAINGIITGVVGFLSAQVAVIRAQLLLLEIQLVPLNATKALLQTAVDTITSVGNLVPVQLIAGCAGLGDIMQYLNVGLEPQVAALNKQLDAINRKLSFKAQLTAVADELDATVLALNTFQTDWGTVVCP